MLHEFTWQQFLVAAMVLSLVWYVGVVLLLYRKEVLFWFGKSRGKEPKERLPHRWQKGVVEVSEVKDHSLVEEDLMGKAKLPDGMSSVSMGSFGFSQTEDDRESQVGLVPDVLQELKEIFAIIEKEDGNKTDFLNLMEMVKNKFPKISSNPNIPRINQFISEHSPFYLTPEEMENLWD